MVETKSIQALLCGVLQIARADVVRQHFRRHEDLAARHGRSLDGAADFDLVAIHVGRVDVAIAKFQRICDRTDADVVLEA